MRLANVQHMRHLSFARVPNSSSQTFRASASSLSSDDLIRRIISTCFATVTLLSNDLRDARGFLDIVLQDCLKQRVDLVLRFPRRPQTRSEPVAIDPTIS